MEGIVVNILAIIFCILCQRDIQKLKGRLNQQHLNQEALLGVCDKLAEKVILNAERIYKIEEERNV